MKFLLPLFLLFQVNAVELARFTECSDPAANIVYLQLPTENTLLVTAVNESNGQHEKLELEDFFINQTSSMFLEKRNLFNCSNNTANIDEELTFRKIKIFNNFANHFFPQ